MKKRKQRFCYLIITSCVVAMSLTTHAQEATFQTSVPLGGNSWVTAKAQAGRERVTNEGWMNWSNRETVFSTYIYFAKKGSLQISAVIKLPVGESKIKCTIAGESKELLVSGAANEYVLGQWQIQHSGYVKIDVQGISKTDDLFGIINEFQISGSAVDAQTVYVKKNEGNYFYWGRRGPSVHLNYDLSEVGNDIEWFYNEITVPANNDPVGSYFMANGFAEGYFGMQVNSPTERRILFSVWSPFQTDDPKQIPEDKKIVMLKKGKDVYTGEFGNEGSGGQSYLKYNWKAGETCRFLLRAKPVENNYTNYTAYFYASEQKKWLLIASFNRPATSTYLKRLHSFLENFDPSTGNMVRKAFYHNQWVRTVAGEWKALKKATFTGDATAQKEYRLDYAGGSEQDRFFLQNCGFFQERTLLRSEFKHPAPVTAPVINFSMLD